MIGGISRWGRTELIIFDGKLNSTGFCQCLQIFLLPFINEHQQYHRLHMDNAPSHTANSTREFIELNHVNHFKTPAQSPKLMPIELVWHDLKVFISNEIN